jgi:hypothetical protein
MADEPSTRVSRFQVRVDQLERTLTAGGIYPDNADSREKFGTNYRKLLDLLDRQERRRKWMAGIGTTVFAGAVTALAIAFGPALWSIIKSIGK